MTSLRNATIGEIQAELQRRGLFPIPLTLLWLDEQHALLMEADAVIGARLRQGWSMDEACTAQYDRTGGRA